MIPEPHRRFDQLSGEWVLVSPGRTDRPWQGSVDRAAADLPSYDRECYLCPGNRRAGGERNPDYRSTFAFTNDFAALRPQATTAIEDDGMLQAHTEPGTCRVICFSPRHDLTLARMTPEEIGAVIELWVEETAGLGEDWTWVQVFENRGEMMGASNPHPHGQVWATSRLPNRPAVEDHRQAEHHRRTGRLLLADYLKQELGGERVVVEGEEWVALVPYWAAWPFETLLLPRRPIRRLPETDPSSREDLARVLGELLTRQDNLFGVSFPYSMGWHGAPFGDLPTEHWTLHAHFYPPLLRSATVRKFMVGYELLGEAQRDITPEEAAARLRSVSAIHYLDR